MSLKRTLIERGMKLMSDPRVMKLLSNPKVMNLVMKGFQLRGKAQAQIDAQIKSLARMLKLATREEVAELKRTIRVLEEQLRQLQAESDRPRGRAAQA
jgi:hypothetical protein